MHNKGIKYISNEFQEETNNKSIVNIIQTKTEVSFVYKNPVLDIKMKFHETTTTRGETLKMLRSRPAASTEVKRRVMGDSESC